MLHLSHLCGQKAELLLGSRRRQQETRMKVIIPAVGGDTDTDQMIPSELPIYPPSMAFQKNPSVETELSVTCSQEILMDTSMLCQR